jgi:hypothetical protein
VFFPFRPEYLIDDGVRKVDAHHQLEVTTFLYDWLSRNTPRDLTVIYRHDLSFFENARAIAAALGITTDHRESC